MENHMNKKMRSILWLSFICLVSCTWQDDLSYEWEKGPYLDPAWRSVQNQQDALALIQTGKDLNPPDGASPLLYAPNIELKELLLKHGADPNHIPQHLRNPSMGANEKNIDLHPMRWIKSGREGRLLLSYGGKVPPNALVNFHRQFLRGGRKGDDMDSAMLFLIKQGADVHLEKYKEASPAHILGLLDRSTIMNQSLLAYLKKCGVDLSAAQMNQIIKPGRPYIFDNCFENQLELIRAGVDPNLRDPFTGDTLLMYDLRQVERRGGFDFNTWKLHHFIKELLRMGANPALKNNEGRTAASYTRKDKTLLKLLIRHGGNEHELETLGPPAPEPFFSHPGMFKTFRSYGFL